MVLTFPILYSICEMHRRIISCILLFLFTAPIPIQCAPIACSICHLPYIPFNRCLCLNINTAMRLLCAGTCSIAQWHHLLHSKNGCTQISKLRRQQLRCTLYSLLVHGFNSFFMHCMKFHNQWRMRFLLCCTFVSL